MSNTTKLASYSEDNLLKRLEEIRVELMDFHVSAATCSRLLSEKELIVEELKKRGYTSLRD